MEPTMVTNTYNVYECENKGMPLPMFMCVCYAHCTLHTVYCVCLLGINVYTVECTHYTHIPQSDSRMQLFHRAAEKTKCGKRIR